MIHDFLRRVTQVRNIDVYGFLLPVLGSLSLKRLKKRYNAEWMVSIRSINNLSVEITNELCDQYPNFPPVLTNYCKM